MNRNELDQCIVGDSWNKTRDPEDLEVEEAQSILDEAGSGWTALHDAALLSCHGDVVEWDQERCPTCGRYNPLVEFAYI